MLAPISDIPNGLTRDGFIVVMQDNREWKFKAFYDTYEEAKNALQSGEAVIQYEAQ